MPSVADAPPPSPPSSAWQLHAAEARSPSGSRGATPRHCGPLTGPRATAYDQGRPALIPLIPLIALICATGADPGWVPGQRVAHLGHAGYLLIAEIIARRSGTAFAEFL
ncbi:hypothetical protein ABT072_36760 [Streptomyces sp. NPDC002589]|uniref:hypothetical protein n=1 Tax=Streptomyces sp. NPDC002589 TaxID=3154420 RepID=UPI00332D86BF